MSRREDEMAYGVRDFLGKQVRQELPPPGDHDDYRALAEFIHLASEDGCEELEIRALALPFGYVDMINRCWDDRDDFEEYAAIHRQLLRDVASYFVRLRKFWEKQMRLDDERERAGAAQ